MAFPPLQDAVGTLIEQAEKLYSAGVIDFQAGNLENAKKEFDQAVSLLLESKLDLESDDRLSAELDKLVEDIHGVELAALERGDTLAEHLYEPAPIESFADLTFPVDPNVNKKVQQEVKTVRSDLPLVSNDFVAGVINYFQFKKRGQGFMERVLQRIGLYQQIISETLSKEALPQELIYLAGAESTFNPFALSRAGAKGIWQLMLERALQYGLKKDRWVDEREDPVKSTQAAVRHLKDLYQMFGDWYLAMAAYNCGPYAVQRAIEKTGYADFWSLRRLRALPKETENYVPIILATAIIAKDPRAFGFDVQPQPRVAADQVIVSAPTDLRLVAQLVDRPVEELIQLNPSLLRWTTPANDPRFVLNLPAGTKEKYELAIASIPRDKRVWWRVHKVEHGETLFSISRKFRVSKAALVAANQINGQSVIREGALLILPNSPGREASLVRVRERASRHFMRYRIKPGDTPELIADRFDVTPYQIRRWNRLTNSELVPGRTIRLYVAGGDMGGAPRSRRRASGSKARKTQAGIKTHPAEGSQAKTSPGASSGPETATHLAYR